MNTTYELEKLNEEVLELQAATDDVFLIACAFSIFFMQTGFLLLEAGAVRAKNSRSIMIKNVCDACFGLWAWYFFGYAIGGGVHLPNAASDTVDFILSYGFAVTTCTIVSGGVASRMKFEPYMIYSIIMCGWIYPVMSKWAWGEGQWLAEMGFKDFAGSGPVHLVGGISSLIGAIALKPRLGRFRRNGEDRGIKGHSDALVVLGFFILWFGWFSFNSGSSGGTDAESLATAKRAAINTMVASCFAGSYAILICHYALHKTDIGFIVNGILGGLVCVTGGCAFIDTWAAALIGCVGCQLTYSTSNLLSSKRFQVDDPLDATAVHCINGFAGVIFTGLFDIEGGLLMTGETSLFVAQVVGAFAIMGWSGAHALVFFFGVSKVMPMRCGKDDELLGLDFKYCDGYAFDDMTADQVRQQAMREAGGSTPRS